MTFLKGREYDVRLAFWDTHNKFQQTGTEEVKADEINILKEKVEFEKNRQPRH